jgi:hypothetical protein
MPRHTLAGEVWSFIRTNKKWWMLPLLALMLVLGTLLVAAHGSALAPFIYTVF